MQVLGVGVSVIMTVDFSIVLPAFNDLPLFRRTLESVRIQKDVSIEIIIMDDSNKNDDIERYVASLSDERIVYRHNIPSLGAVSNWNSGLGIANGRNIMLIHHDEALVSDTFLKRVGQKLLQNEIVVADIEVHRNDGKVYGLYPGWFKKAFISCPALFFAINAIGPCAVVAMRKEVVQMFDASTRWFVDVEWYYRVFRHRKACYLPSVVIASCHGHKGQITNNIDTMAEAKHDASMLRGKYGSHILVRLAIWVHIYVLHNEGLHKLLTGIFRR